MKKELEKIYKSSSEDDVVSLKKTFNNLILNKIKERVESKEMEYSNLSEATRKGLLQVKFKNMKAGQKVLNDLGEKSIIDGQWVQFGKKAAKPIINYLIASENLDMDFIMNAYPELYKAGLKGK